MSMIQLTPLTDQSIILPSFGCSEEMRFGTDTWLYRIMHPEDQLLAELVLTPFERSLWRDFWYVLMVNREQKGVFAKLVSFLRERHINIVGMTSTTVDHGLYHVSKMAIDCRGHKNEIDLDHQAREHNPASKLSRLRRELIVHFIHELRLFDPSYPSLLIQRDHSLWTLYNQVRQAGSQVALIKKGENVYCQIPSKEIERIAATYSRVCNLTIQQLGEPQALVTFDEASHLTRICIFFSNLGIVPILVSVNDRPGALAAVAETLCREDFNILASKAWTLHGQDRMYMWALVRHMSKLIFPFNDAEIADRINEELVRSKASSEYDLKIETSRNQ